MFVNDLIFSWLRLIIYISEVTISAPDESDSEDDVDAAPITLSLNTLAASSGQPLTIFDGQEERRLKSMEAEERRIRSLVEVLVGMRLEGIEWGNAPYEHCGREGVIQLKLPVVGTEPFGEFILTILLSHLRKH